LVDPYATAIVYRTITPEHLSIGLDVTTQCNIPIDVCVQKFHEIGGPLSVVSEATKVWGEHSKMVTFHDPLTAAAIFNPTLCEYAEGEVTVNLAGDERLLGTTLFDANAPQKPHRIATKVDSDRFFAEYFATVGGK